MALTSPQLATLKAFILATPALAAQPMNSDGAFAIARALNTAAAPAFTVWNPTASLDAVQEAVSWASLTPNDAPDGTATWTNRSLACQGKQKNLQMLLTRPSGTIRGDLSRTRTGLQDALTNVPSGTAGAPVDAGWLGATGARLALQRAATEGEKLFATGAGTTANPATMALVGDISISDVEAARAS